MGWFGTNLALSTVPLRCSYQVVAVGPHDKARGDKLVHVLRHRLHVRFARRVQLAKPCGVKRDLVPRDPAKGFAGGVAEPGAGGHVDEGGADSSCDIAEAI